MLFVRICAALAVVFGLAGAEVREKGWWKNTIFYQIYPRSFKDSNDDGIGDLRGITDKLQYFKNSGIGAIWLSPIYASPMVDFGYDISDFRQVDPSFGTMADFEYLTKKAKALGLKVVLDLVPNHTSDQHYWFKESLKNDSKYNNYYIWKDGPNGSSTVPPNNWISVFSGPAWTYRNETKKWYFHQFEYRQPDLNYANPDVQQEMIDVIKFWLGKGVDGFRIDAIPHLFEDDNLTNEPRSSNKNVTDRDYAYLDHIYTKDDNRTYTTIASWRKVMDEWADQRNETEKVMMTEAYTDLTNTTKYYTYGSNIPFNFKFITDIGSSSKPNDYKKAIDSWMQAMTKLNKSYVANWVMGNHDNPRIASRFPGRADQLTILALTLPGAAITYYGEEIGMEDYRYISWEDTQDPQACNAGEELYKERSRDPERTPFQWDNSTNAGFNEGAKTWLPVHNNSATLNLANQMKTPQSSYKLYVALTALKKTSPALINGTLETRTLNNNTVLGIFRENKNANDSISVLVNFLDDQEQTVNISGYLAKEYKSAVLYAASSNVKGVNWGSTLKLDAVKLPAKATYILKSSMNSQGGQGSGASTQMLNSWLTMFTLSSVICLLLNSV